MFALSPRSRVVVAALISGSTLITGAVTGNAGAQQLPAPAPIPGSPAPKRTPGPVYVPPEPLPPSDNDIIELDPPVRHTNPTPRPSGTPIAQATGRPSVGGVSIIGLKDAAAVRKLQHALAPKLQTVVTLTDGQDEYYLHRSQLGVTIPYLTLISEARRSGGDRPLRFVVDTQKAQASLRALRPQIERPLQPVSLDVEDGKVVLRGGDGVTLAVPGSAWRVKLALEAEPPLSRVELVVQRKVGSNSEATLSQFRYLLSSFSTPYDAGIRGRTNNLRMAARHVDGTIVPDGTVFSTNRAIGPRNAEAGWREAKMFVNGQIIDGVGAGICQCSTTVYNAALLAGLPIVERHPHSFRVTYAPASRDAAIYWGSKDMRFRNDTGGPIYVQTFLTGGRFHVRLYSATAPRHKVEVESVTLSRARGTRSEAYRVFYTSSGRQRQLLSRDYYKPKP